MAALKDQGWSYREIGAFFGIKHMEIVRRIISRVPAEARGMRGTAKLVG